MISRFKIWLQGNPIKHRAICVLGMHRSGTSFLTGSLQTAGVELHRFHTENPHNKKGNRENQDIVELNTWVLDSNGGSWDKPPQDIQWSEAQKARAIELVEQYSQYPLWGFKDPRTLITLNHWKQLIPHVEFVGIFRHPLAVAQSLNARNPKTSIDEGIALWTEYNGRLLKQYQSQSFPLIQFDQSSDTLLAATMQVCKSLGLQVEASTQFFDQGLVNQKELSDVELPSECAAILTQLRSVAIK